MKKRICLLFLGSLAGFAHAEMGLVREYVETNGVPQRISETPMAVGANYETATPPVYAGYIFTHWTMNVEGATRDVLGRAYEQQPYHLTNRIDLTAHYLPANQDLDADGVADAYEIYWYGDLGQGADSDTDGDGYTFADELKNGTSPLIADGEVEGPIVYADGEMTLYNPNGYAQFTISSETEGLVTPVDETCRPGMSVSTPTLSPTTSKFAYWTRNGEPVRDELGRAIDGITLTIGEAVENFVAVGIADYDTRMKLYWYGDESVEMDSDTDGDGFTFAEELKNGTNPLMADGDVEGPVQFADGELILYNPFDYKQVVITTRTGDNVQSNSCEYLRPGTVVETENKSPASSQFAYWTRNGVPCRDELGRAIDRISFSMGTEIEELESVQIADANTRQKLYWYGTTDVAMDSDTDGDGFTFAQELANGTNPLMADGEVEGPVLFADGRLLLYDPNGVEDACVAKSEGYSGKYDGEYHGISVTVLVPASGYTVGYSLQDTGPFSPTMPTFKDVGEWMVWYRVTAPEYEELVECEKVVVGKKEIDPGDDPDPTDPSVDPDDPGQREDPDVRFSKFDYVGKYDGAYHTIDTNSLKQAWMAVMGTVTVGYATASNGMYQADAFAFKDAVVTSFWYKVTSANYADIVKPCKVAITNRLVTLTSGTQQWTYDGNAHSNMTVTVAGDGFVAGEGVTANGFATITDVGSVPNSFAYAFLSNTLAANYSISCVTGTLTVMQGTLPPGDDPDPLPPGVDPDDPGQREDPDVRFSKFDYVGKYDGAYHTIDTNSLKQAWMAVMGTVTVGYATASNGMYQADAFAFKDAVVTSFWYKVTSANYSDIVKPCKVAVTNRLVTLTSGTDQWTYDGNAHSNMTVTVSGDGFVAGEGVATNGFATITDVGSVPNAFAYSFLPGTLAANYAVTCVTGTLTVTQGTLPPGDDPDPLPPGVDPDDPEQRDDPDVRFSKFDYVGKYDGAYHTIDTNSLKQAWTAVMGTVTVGYATASNGMYQADAFAFKDAVVTSFWYKVTSANYADIVKPCKVAITNRLVTLSSGTQQWTYDSGVHSNLTVTVSGDGFVSGEGVTTNGFATITDVGLVPNAFSYSLLPNTLVANYAVSCVTGTLTVVKGTLPPGDDPDPTDPSVDPDDPGQKEDPDVRFSAFDYVGVYDGETHTIDTNALKTAYLAVLGDCSCMYARIQDGEWTAEPLIFKDAVVTSFWYKVTSANYADIVKPCKVAITNRLVTLTSGTEQWTYDGNAHSNITVTVGGDGFVAGEGVTTYGFATITDVGLVPNAFSYSLLPNTLAANYAVSCETGTLTVVKGGLPPEIDPDPTDPSVDPDDPGQRDDPDVRFSAFDYVGKYDGEAHTIGTNALKQAWTAALGAVTVGYATASNGIYQSDAFAFKDAVVTSFWYKVMSANYADIVKPCKVAITNRCVTFTSPDKTKDYDGMPLTFTAEEIEVGGDGYAEGESFVFSAFASIVDAGTTNATFECAAGPDTKLENYSISVVTGLLTVVAAPVPVPTDWDMIPTESYFGEYAMVEGHVMSVTNPPNIEFDLATEQWKLGFIVRWPGGPGNYTPPEDAKIRLSTSGRTFTGADILAGDTDGELLSIETNRFGYVAFVTWETYLTPEDAYLAHEDGEIDFKYVMTAGAGTSDLRPEGIADSDFTLVIPLGNLELRDINGYRVYPVHLHTWAFTPMLGYMLAANCISDPEYELECATPEYVAMSLGATPISRFIYTGRPVSFELYNADAFRYRTGAIVGGVVYRDSDGMALEGAPSEVGEYTAEVTVVPMGASPVTLRRSFTIFSLFNASLESEAPTLLGVTRDEARRLRIVDLRMAPKVRFGMTVGGAAANLPLKLSSEQVAPFVQVTTDLAGKWEAIRPERMTIDSAGRVTITPEADRLTEFYRFAVPLGD